MTPVHSIDASTGTGLSPDDGVVIDDCGTILILPSRVRDTADAERARARKRVIEAVKEVYGDDGSGNGEGNGTPDTSSRKQAKRDAAHAAARARKAIKRQIKHDNVRRSLQR